MNNSYAVFAVAPVSFIKYIYFLFDNVGSDSYEITLYLLYSGIYSYYYLKKSEKL